MTPRYEPIPAKSVNPGYGTAAITTFTRGEKAYELSNYLGNVLTTISDKRLPVSTSGTSLDYYTADVVSATDYAPFGMGMVGRSVSSGKYRYGCNGKENDNEVKGEGNQQDYGMRIYDPRVGRFLSTDPLSKQYPFYSPYQFSGDNPVRFIDLDGLEPSNNPKTPGVKEKAAMATVQAVFYQATKHNFYENALSPGTWSGQQLQGSYSCSSTPIVTGGGVAKKDNSGTYVSDNTGSATPEKLNTYVSSTNTFNVDESNSSKFLDYEAFVVNELVAGFATGIGPENYNFPTNGIISSKFKEAEIFKSALQEYNSEVLKPNEVKQYSFGVIDLFKDAGRNVTLFSITGFTGSGTITFVPNANGIKVTIFNVTSLSSGALIKNPSDPDTFPKSYVRDSSTTTEYGNISQTYNLFIPFGDKLLK